MYESNRNIVTLLALGVVTAAVLGYLIGSRGGVASRGHPATPAVHLSPSFGSSVVLESPSGWRQASGAAQIPGLAVTHATTFAPGGDAGKSGLLTGEVPGGEPSPLPASFVAQLRGIPHTEVVALGQIEAYRYSGLTLRGFDKLLTIYAIPIPGAAPTVLACYAPPAAESAMRTCEQVVATLRLVGQSGGTGLSPDPAYARQVAAAVGQLDGARATLRRGMQSGATLASVQHLAASLSASFAGAGTALAGVEPPLAAVQAQASLAHALHRAAAAYAALAAGAAANDLGGYEAARQRVYEAEAGVDSSLESFSLLGYDRP